MNKQLIFCLLFLVSACAGELKGLDKPKELIPKEKMVELMTDLFILEAHVQGKYQIVNRYYKVMTSTAKSYLKTHHVSESQYRESYEYYISNKEDFEEIMNQVEENLLKESYQTKKE